MVVAYVWFCIQRVETFRRTGNTIILFSVWKKLLFLEKERLCIVILLNDLNKLKVSPISQELFDNLSSHFLKKKICYNTRYFSKVNTWKTYENFWVYGLGTTSKWTMNTVDPLTCISNSDLIFNSIRYYFYFVNSFLKNLTVLN